MTTVLCRSTGPILPAARRLGVLCGDPRIKKPWLLMLVIAVAPLYAGLRTSRRSGRAARWWSRQGRRSGEDGPVARIPAPERGRPDPQGLRRPIFGWGRPGGRGSATRRQDDHDRRRLLDHRLRADGLIGLAAMDMMMLLPVVLTHPPVSRPDLVRPGGRPGGGPGDDDLA